MAVVSSSVKPENLNLNELVGKNWVTIAQAAKILERDYRTVRGWVHPHPETGITRIKAVKVGGQYRIYEDELKRILVEGTDPDKPHPI
jgi:excisionase family DNA binding protein